VHMLTVSAFNALLKTLEEPPSHIKFIFATTEPNKVIATIQSRCQRFDFSNIGAAEIAKQLKVILKKEKIKYEDDLVLALAKMANGSMRDGLSLLDRLISAGAEPLTVKLLEEFLGQPNSEKIWDLIGRIGNSDAAGTLATIDDLIGTGISEVQIVDSVIDYMRDLMVVKSTSPDSELVILTAQQRQRAGELAESFDVAALVYSISTLEKLRWAIRNSDTPRALLEASLLRFTLSEHFLNVDVLLSQLKGASGATAKKKAPVIAKNQPSVEPPKPIAIESPVSNVETAASPAPCNIQLIKDRWQGTLSLVSSKLGPGTGGLLSCARPSRFENGTLALEFDPSDKIKKGMCERNGRPEQIEALLSEEFSAPIKVKFEVGGAQTKAESKAEQEKTGSQRRNELFNDPAVKTVLMGLDATITGIEESQQ